MKDVFDTIMVILEYIPPKEAAAVAGLTASLLLYRRGTRKNKNRKKIPGEVLHHRFFTIVKRLDRKVKSMPADAVPSELRIVIANYFSIYRDITEKMVRETLEVDPKTLSVADLYNKLCTAVHTTFMASFPPELHNVAEQTLVYITNACIPIAGVFEHIDKTVKDEGTPYLVTIFLDVMSYAVEGNTAAFFKSQDYGKAMSLVNGDKK